MAKRGSPDSFLYVGGYNLTGYTLTFTDKISALIEEDTVIGTSFVTHSFTGVRQAELTQNAFYDDAALGSLAALTANHATSPVLCYGVEGTATGAGFVGYTGALEVDYEKVISRGELHKLNVNYKGTGQVDKGQILQALNTKTSSGQSTGAPVDYGSSNTSGAVAYLQVTAFTSGPSTAFQADIMHSADNITYTSWGGFVSATAAPMANRLSSTAKIERYNAVRWAGGGAGTSFPTSVTFFIGIARN